MLKIFRAFWSSNKWCTISEKHVMFLLQYLASGKSISEGRQLCDWWAGSSYSHQMFGLFNSLTASRCSLICFTTSFRPTGHVVEEQVTRNKIEPQEVTLHNDWQKSTAAVDFIHWSPVSFVSLYVPLVGWLKAFIENGFPFFRAIPQLV